MARTATTFYLGYDSVADYRDGSSGGARRTQSKWHEIDRWSRDCLQARSQLIAALSERSFVPIDFRILLRLSLYALGALGCSRRRALATDIRYQK